MLTDFDTVLTTTRSVRKRLDFDRPVSCEVIQECLDLAIQAPTGSNQQGWHFVVLTDPEPKKIVADAYRRAFDFYAKNIVPNLPPRAADDPRTHQSIKVTASAIYLAENLERAPVMIIPCIEGRFETQPVFVQAAQYGSILPAAWSLMLALRSRGLGTAWTTLHLMFEQEVSRALGIPDTVTQTALFPVAYTLGDEFKPAARIPASQVTSWNSWGSQGEPCANA